MEEHHCTDSATVTFLLLGELLLCAEVDSTSVCNAAHLTPSNVGESDNCVVAVLPFLSDVFGLLSELKCSRPGCTRSVSSGRQIDGFYKNSDE